jgi:ComF family protein
VAPSCCPGCDTPRAGAANLLCPDCARGLRPLAELEGVRTAIAYTATGARLVQRFKFEGRRDALRVLVPPLVERLFRLRFDTLVPVPRHPARIREQGCDPAWELARRLGRALGVRVRDAALERTRASGPQLELPPRERWRNVEGAFRARPGALAGRQVLLLDDVVTTGATLESAARELERGSGATRVLRAALAATPLAVS